MELCKILINKIEQLCQNNNITVNQMLLKCGLRKDVVNNMKKEKPSIPSVDKIQKIAQYFNVSVDYLLGYNPEPQKDEKSEKLLALASVLTENQVDSLIEMSKKFLET